MGIVFALDGWFYWAAMSALFAALSVIFSKAGLEGIDSALAMRVRTITIVFVLGAFVWLSGKWVHPLFLSGRNNVR